MISVRQPLWFLVFPVFLLVLSVTGMAQAGSCCHGILFEDALGIDLQGYNKALKVGDTFNAIVVDKSKLTKFGYNGVKIDQKVTLKVLQINHKFEVVHQATGMTKTFLINPAGEIVLEK